MSFIRSMKTIRGLSPGVAVPGEASQDGPEQQASKPRSDENVVTPKSREKSTFV